MDLLATVRKEGSRGGRGEFNWSDVQSSSRREHYLGHSLMAPVGRYSKGRDLNWYAKGNGDDQDGEDAAQTAARERKEEIKLIKQAEEDALAKALGLPVPERNNANMEPVSDKREVDKAVKEASSLDHGAGRGIGFGRHAQASNELTETIQGNAEGQDRELHYALNEYKRRNRDEDRKPRSQSRDREKRHHKADRDHHRKRRRDRSGEGLSDRPSERRHRRRSRSRSPGQGHDRRHQDRERDRSPYRSRRDDHKRR